MNSFDVGSNYLEKFPNRMLQLIKCAFSLANEKKLVCELVIRIFLLACALIDWYFYQDVCQMTSEYLRVLERIHMYDYKSWPT